MGHRCSSRSDDDTSKSRRFGSRSSSTQTMFWPSTHTHTHTCGLRLAPRALRVTAARRRVGVARAYEARAERA